MRIIDVFLDSVNHMVTDINVAKKGFEYVFISLNESKKTLSKDDLWMLALSGLYLFKISGMNDISKAEVAIKSFEEFFSNYNDDISLYESYILILELTYQYEKSHTILKELLNSNDRNKKRIALKFLTSYTYCAAGLQTVDELNGYKKQLAEETRGLRKHTNR